MYRLIHNMPFSSRCYVQVNRICKILQKINSLYGSFKKLLFQLYPSEKLELSDDEISISCCTL